MTGAERDLGGSARVARLVSLVSALVALATVGVPPAVLFAVEHERLNGTLLAETELTAHAVTQLIGRDPTLWRFEQARLVELLSERTLSGSVAEERRVIDERGEVVVTEHGALVPAPLLTRSHAAMDAGVPVARVEIGASLRPALIHAGLLLLALLPIGLAVHRFLCTVPLSALRRAEAALWSERDRAKRTLEAAGVALAILDGDGNVVELNPKAVEVLGRPRDELVGRPWVPLFEDAEREEIARALSPGERDGRPPFETQVRRSDGTRGVVMWFASALGDAQDAPALLLSGIDVTVQRELEAQVLHDEKLRAIGKLAGGIAHDFNNVLSVVTGVSSAMLEELPDDHPHRADLAEILGATDRAVGLTRSLLAFSRRRAVQMQPTDLVEVLRRSEALLRRLVREDVRLKLALPETPLPVLVDPVQLDSVLMNLVGNAKDAMPEGGRIVVSARAEELERARAASWGVEPGPYAVVAVSDEGIGMSGEMLGRLFEPFFTTKEIGRGTGLGLAVSHGIMRQHGGGIRVTSEQGVGTTVALALPRRDGDAGRTAPASAGRSVGGTETILIAEDDPAVRRVLRRTLERAGYEVIEAVDGVDAVDEFRAHHERIGLVILDVVMPGMNGRQALDRIRALRPEARAILVSGHAQHPAGGPPIEVSGEPYLQKPAPPDELLRMVRSVLDAALGARASAR
jgi:PAS domain S-box-containing protein